MEEKILVTGGAGFIGSNFIRNMFSSRDYFIVNLDALTYAGNLENLSVIENHPNYRFVRGSIQNEEICDYLFAKYHFDGVINFAAESHVDRSISNARPFVDTNITGTLVLLETARRYGVKKFLQVSTDEVYGSLGKTGYFVESTPLSPNSPYSASKSSADQLVMVFYHTYNFPSVITRCSNNYGPYQFPEKLIPLMLLNALEDKPLPVYGDGMNVRDWLHVDDHCTGILAAYEKGRTGEVYNIGGSNEKTNIEIVRLLLEITGKDDSLIKYVKDRLGHDRRYAIDSTKIQNELGWKPEIDFRNGLANCVQWYMDHPQWCERVRSGAYRDYYAKQYGD